MKVLVVDPFQTGHHLIYLYHITEAFLKNGASVVTAGDMNEEFTNKFDLVVQQYPDKFKFTGLADNHGGYCDKSTLLYSEIVKQRWLKINELVSSYNEGFDLVFLPWLDSYIDGRLKREFYDKLNFKWAGIYFQPYFLNKLISNIDKCKFLDPRILFEHNSCAGLSSLVDSAEVKKHPLFKAKPLHFIPDFADMEIDHKNDFSEEIKIKSAGRFTIGLYGSLAKRKGIMELFQAIDKYSLFEDNFFIIAGEFIDSDFSSDDRGYLLDIIKNNSDSFFFHPERLGSEVEFNYLMSQCDVVYAAYRNFFFSSNMLIKSAELNKPVIVAKDTYMGDEVGKYQLGLTIDVEPDRIVEAIKKIKHGEYDITDATLAGKFIEKHSLRSLEKVVADMLHELN